MKTMFKVATESNLTQLEMSQDVLDLAIIISDYIEKKPMESDFFCIRPSITEDQFTDVLKKLKQTKSELAEETETTSLSLEEGEYQVFEALFSYAYNFGDDIPELEAHHDQICPIAELM